MEASGASKNLGEDYLMDVRITATAMTEAPKTWDRLKTSPNSETDSATPTMISISRRVADWVALIEDRPRVYIARATTVQGTPSQTTDSHSAGTTSVPRERGPPAIAARGASITVMDTIKAKELARVDMSYFFPSTMNVVYPMDDPTSRKSPETLPDMCSPEGKTSTIPKALRATAALDEFGRRSCRTKKAATGTKITNRLDSRAEAEAPEAS